MMVDKQHHANAGMSVRERVLPQALVLVKSSLLQGQALQVTSWCTGPGCSFSRYQLIHFITPLLIQATVSYHG
jgi:hypothetical protein